MTYQPTHFDKLPDDQVLHKGKGRHGNAPYVFNDDIAIAIDVALATNRPLLVSGNPGCGKSRLADAVAAVQGWSLLSKTMTSRTRLESLTAEVDQLRRLNDAQIRTEQTKLKPDACYLNPGLFWWAYERHSACRRGLSPDEVKKYQVNPLQFPGTDRSNGQPGPVVLLIDEIDKAEPDLPNDLLELLDRRCFDLPDGFSAQGATKIEWDTAIRLLTIITTNGERELPQAFLRRCVRLHLPDPNKENLTNIATNHFGKTKIKAIEKIAEKTVELRDTANRERRRPPGTSEFLDAVRAFHDLGIPFSEDPDSTWKKIERAVLIKEPDHDLGQSR